MVRPKPVDFAQKNVREVKVDLRYASSDEEWADRFSFDSSEGREYFEFNYTDPAKTRYQHKETYFFNNGMSRETDWVESDANEAGPSGRLIYGRTAPFPRVR